MDNKEFEKKLGQIKTFKEVPISVDEKIQKAFEKIEKNEKVEKEVKKQKSKFNFSRILSLAASFVMLIFLAGNGVAYAKGEPNIYSWILEKIGIQKEYEEIKTDINQTVESNGVKITLIDCGYDSRIFMARYKIEDINGELKQVTSNLQSKEISEYNDLCGDYKFYTDKNQEVVNPDETINSEGQVWEKISDFEYIVCDNIIISEVNWNGIITDVEINLNSINIENPDDIYEDYTMNGKWNFKVEKLNDRYNKYKFQELDINKNIDKKMMINSIRVVDTGVWGILEINYIFEEFSSVYDYVFEVTDINNNKLGKFEICSESLMITHKYMPHLNENEKYRILIYDNSKEEKNNPIEVIEFIYNEQ